jgi:hypothetical protein
MAVAASRSWIPLTALVVATLIGIDAVLQSWAQLSMFGAFSSWGRAIGSIVPLVLGLVTFALVVMVIRKRRSQPPGLPRPSGWAWLVFVAAGVIGYLMTRDGYSYWTYLYREGGLPGGCYTQLELLLRVPHQSSWIRDLEQSLGSTLLYGSSLALLVMRQPMDQHVCREPIPIEGA